VGEVRDRSSAWRVLALLGLVLAAHSPALRADFLWDDEFWLWNSPLTQAGDGLLRAWYSGDRWDFYPITSSVFWVMWRIAGNGAAGYHLLNLALHGLGAVLLWRVFRELRLPAAWLTAAVFVVHPVTVGTVAWITQLKNTLSLAFYALAILAYLRFDREPVPDRTRWYAGALLAFVAALLCKASVVMLPVVLLLLIHWRRGRLGKGDLVPLVPIFALSAASAAVTIAFQSRRAFGGAAEMTESFATRLAAAGRCVDFYALKAVLPTDLAIIYPRWEVDAVSVTAWLPLFLLGAVFCVAVLLRGGAGRALRTGLGAYVATLFPVLGFFAMYYTRYSRVADHWQYHALPAALALGIGAGAVLLRRAGALLPRIVGAILILALGAQTFRQSRVYENEGTFWSAVLERNPAAWVAWNGQGTWLGRQGDHEEARRHFERAVELNPEYALGWNNLGKAHERTGDLERAEDAFRRAIRVRPDLAEAVSNLGSLLARRGELDEGIDRMREAVRLAPLEPGFHFRLALAQAQRGDPAAAAEDLRAVVRLAPDDIEARYLLAKTLVQTGNLREARIQLLEVVHRDPGYDGGAAQQALQAVRKARPGEGRSTGE
jgi:Flp pilus assembly protein TadD